VHRPSNIGRLRGFDAMLNWSFLSPGLQSGQGRNDMIRVLIFATLVACLGVARAAEPIANFENQPVSTAAGTPAASQVRDAIIAAGTFKQWKFQDAGPGKLVGTLIVRNRHMIEVAVTYDARQYSVVYSNSVNMNYEAADSSIHPNYNRWVRELVDSIGIAIATVKPEGNATAVSAAPAAGAVVVPAAAAPTTLAVSQSPWPQPGDQWTYRLSEPKRRDGPQQRTYVATVSSASPLEIVDQVSVDGGNSIATKHAKGPYLVAPGAWLFSPYLAVFDELPAGTRLSKVSVDDACTGAYICDVTARVVGRETVKVAAGTFDAVRVQVEQGWRPGNASSGGNQHQAGQLNGGRRLTIWYAPAVKRAVKYSSRVTVGDYPPLESNFDLELVSYKLK